MTGLLHAQSQALQLDRRWYHLAPHHVDRPDLIYADQPANTVRTPSEASQCNWPRAPAHGPRADLTALAQLDTSVPRHTAVAAYLHERDGDVVTAARPTPKPLDRHPAFRNAIILRARRHGSTHSYVVEQPAPGRSARPRDAREPLSEDGAQELRLFVG